jgi:hypothetical protein
MRHGAGLLPLCASGQSLMLKLYFIEWCKALGYLLIVSEYSM